MGDNKVESFYTARGVPLRLRSRTKNETFTTDDRMGQRLLLASDAEIARA
jgi:hypothetical protein